MFAETSPWRLSRAPWATSQSWYHLLFAHWPLAPDGLRPLIPPGLQLDTYDWEGMARHRAL